MFFLELWLLISPFASLNFSFTLELIKQENIGSGTELKKNEIQNIPHSQNSSKIIL
jgi:hypothetical protein